MESRLGRGLRRAAREEIQLHADPGVARATRLPQAIVFHAFSVKMRARAPEVPKIIWNRRFEISDLRIQAFGARISNRKFEI